MIFFFRIVPSADRLFPGMALRFGVRVSLGVEDRDGPGEALRLGVRVLPEGVGERDGSGKALRLGVRVSRVEPGDGGGGPEDGWLGGPGGAAVDEVFAEGDRGDVGGGAERLDVRV